jgi:hypothetical protein
MQWTIGDQGPDPTVSPRTLTEHPEEPPDSRAAARANRMKSKERIKRMNTLLQNTALSSDEELDGGLEDSYDEDRWDDGEEPDWLTRAAAELESEAIDGRLEDCQSSLQIAEEKNTAHIAELARSQANHQTMLDAWQHALQHISEALGITGPSSSHTVVLERQPPDPTALQQQRDRLRKPSPQPSRPAASSIGLGLAQQIMDLGRRMNPEDDDDDDDRSGPPTISEFESLPPGHFRRQMRRALDYRNSEEFERLRLKAFVPQDPPMWGNVEYFLDSDGSYNPLDANTFIRYTDGSFVIESSDPVGRYLGLPIDY